MKRFCCVVMACFACGDGTSEAQESGPFLQVGTNFHPRALSWTGDVVVGDNNGGRVWTRASGTQPLPCVDELGPCFARGVSADGATIAGYRHIPRGPAATVEWTQAQPGAWAAHAVAGPDQFGSIGACISPNGRFAFGKSYDGIGSNLVRWSDGEGEVLAPLGTLGLSGAAEMASSAASDVVWMFGVEQGPFPPGHLYRWSASEGLVQQPLPSSVGMVYDVAPDVGVAIGMVSVDNLAQPFRWTAHGGLQVLPLPAGVSSATASAISRDGRVIVGYSSLEGLIWDSHHGVRYLRDVAEQAIGSPVSNSLIPRAISADGTTIAGSNFVLRLQAPCLADVDDGSLSGGRDGAVGVEDLLAFLRWFEEGSVFADVTSDGSQPIPDGAVTIDDLLAFLGWFSEGCGA